MAMESASTAHTHTLRMNLRFNWIDVECKNPKFEWMRLYLFDFNWKKCIKMKSNGKPIYLQCIYVYVFVFDQYLLVEYFSNRVLLAQRE